MTSTDYKGSRQPRQEEEANLRQLYVGLTYHFAINPEAKLSQVGELYKTRGIEALLFAVWEAATGHTFPFALSNKEAFDNLRRYKTMVELSLTRTDCHKTDAHIIGVLSSLAEEPVPEGDFCPEMCMAMLLGKASAIQKTYLHDVGLSIRQMSASFIDHDEPLLFVTDDPDDHIADSEMICKYKSFLECEGEKLLKKSQENSEK